MGNLNDYSKIGRYSNLSWSIPEMTIANDYYPFGMLMPRRTLSTKDYRFGFNAKENLNNIKGLGQLVDFGARMYDPRISKFLSVDPKFELYAKWSPYLYSGNNPINLRDINGEGPPEEKEKLNSDLNVGENSEFSYKDENPFRSDSHDNPLPPTPTSGAFTQIATGESYAFNESEPNILEDIFGPPHFKERVTEKRRDISWSYNINRKELVVFENVNSTTVDLFDASKNVQTITTTTTTYFIGETTQLRLFSSDLVYNSIRTIKSEITSSTSNVGSAVVISPELSKRAANAWTDNAINVYEEFYSPEKARMEKLNKLNKPIE